MTNWSSFQAVASFLVLAFAAAGCGSNGDAGNVDECLTSLRINLEVGDGAVIDKVHYEITGNGIIPITGFIDTSAPGSTASVEAFGIPPGKDYLVTMTATSDDGLMCGGAASFNVDAGVSTEVDLILHCTGSEQFGGVRVNGELNVCAELEKVVVAPLQVASGYALSVEAEASDAEGDEIKYRWTATGGSFDNANAPQTVFLCGDADQEEITVEVSDDKFDYCIDGWTIDVTCVDDDEGAGGSGGSGGSSGGGGSGGAGGAGGSAGAGGEGGAGGTAGTGGAGGSAGAGGEGGAGGTAGTGGTGGSGGSGGQGGAGGTAGTGGTGGAGATAGTGGAGGSDGSAGSGGTGSVDECLVSISVR
jgi:hypothetical protein